MRKATGKITLGGKEYKVVIIYKRIRNIYYRYRKEGYFEISCPGFTPMWALNKGLAKFAPSLLKKAEENRQRREEKPDGFYEFGEKKENPPFGEESKDKAYMKKALLDYLKVRVPEYEAIMGVKDPYKVRVRDATSLFGSNSRKTHSLTFALSLFSYRKEIIDSVIVHELAHDKVRNHQKAFYELVYEYCPDYDILRKALKNKDYGGTHYLKKE